MPELLTVTEAAVLLGTSRSQIHVLIADGRLTPFYLRSDTGPKRKVYLELSQVEAQRGTWTPRRR
jgi:excisionase family DNA binding protein